MSDLNMQKSSSFNDYQEEIDYEIGDEDLGNQITDENTVFIQEEDILKEREKMIHEAEEKLFLERPEAILAMIYFEWNLDKLDVWYEDVDNNRIKAGMDLSPKTKALFKQQGVPENGDCCLTCYEEKNDTFYSLKCGHQFCGDCWFEYLKEKLKNPLGALTTTCQKYGCTCIKSK